jgi:hypothetical protein
MHTHAHSLSLSLTHTHTHTHIHLLQSVIQFLHTHTYSLSLSLSLIVHNHTDTLPPSLSTHTHTHTHTHTKNLPVRNKNSYTQEFSILDGAFYGSKRPSLELKNSAGSGCPFAPARYRAPLAYAFPVPPVLPAKNFNQGRTILRRNNDCKIYFL